VQQPEVCCGQFFQKPADPTDEVIRGKERQIIVPDDGGRQRSGRDARVERQRNRKDIGESDAIQEMKRNQPTDRNFRARGSGEGRTGRERKKTAYRNDTTDATCRL